jgi:hypothetical protein
MFLPNRSFNPSLGDAGLQSEVSVTPDTPQQTAFPPRFSEIVFSYNSAVSTA